MSNGKLEWWATHDKNRQTFVENITNKVRRRKLVTCIWRLPIVTTRIITDHRGTITIVMITVNI